MEIKEDKNKSCQPLKISDPSYLFAITHQYYEINFIIEYFTLDRSET